MSGTRPRDATATRRALLDAGRALFAEAGYAQTTVRAIADRAGVNQALLFRYFGSKEGLYAEAVRDDALALLQAGPPAGLLDRVLDAVLEGPRDTSVPLLAMLRGLGGVGGGRVRTELQEAFTAAFARLVPTDGTEAARADAVLRAELLLAWLLGLTLHRSLADPPDPAAVKAHVERAVAALMGPARSAT